jgi:very-short-patch-repair endonuclease
MDRSDALDLAERQHSLIAREQLLAAGWSRQQVWRFLTSEDWEPVTSRVLVRRGAKRTFEQHMHAAVLDAGPEAFLSHSSSAGLWKTSGFGLLRLRGIDVTRPRGGTRRPNSLARIHEVGDLHPDHITVLDDIPISTPTRTIFELAASVHPERAARACDTLWARNLTSRQHLDRMFGDWADCGRAGTVVMREILEARPWGYVPPASNLESRFKTLSERHGIGPFRRQVDLGGQTWLGRVDFLSETCPLVVEVLSEAYHAALCDQDEDARRFARLEEVGFTVESVWDHEIWGDAKPAMERVWAAERRARRRAA